MTLITVHLYNFKNQELDINSDHIVSIESANSGANIQMVSGPTIHTAETRAELNQLINGGGAYSPVLETKSAEGDTSADSPEAPVETPAQRKARLKAEADAAAQQ